MSEMSAKIKLTDYGVYDGGIDTSPYPSSPNLRQIFEGYLDKPLTVYKGKEAIIFILEREES